ncbi:TetR/AcrR family transcriptional regulator [Rhizobium sp. PAMB 3182]
MTNGQDNESPRRGRRPANLPAGRSTLILAATRCFADLGFEAAGVRMIAARAGAAPNLVTIHFGNKEGLWLACVDALAENLAPKLKAVALLSEVRWSGVRERLGAAIAMTAAYYDQNPDLRGFIARGSLEPPPRGPIIADRLLKPIYEAARPLIQEGIDAGVIPIANPALVFVILNATLGQPDRMAAALGILAPELSTDDLAGTVGEAMARLLLQPEKPDTGRR